MSDAREEILRRVRLALRDVPEQERPSDRPITRGYRRERSDPRTELLERFLSRLRDYNADADVVAPGDIAGAVAEACAALGLRSLVIPVGLPDAWRPPEIEIVDDQQLSADQLDAIDGALTGCAVAIAETGTIVLSGRDSSGRRATTLVPDHHICIVGEAQIVAGVPEALARVAEHARAGAPITLVSGPSASSDIELERVEGVHGPRHLRVLIARSECTDGEEPSAGAAAQHENEISQTNQGESQ